MNLRLLFFRNLNQKNQQKDNQNHESMLGVTGVTTVHVFHVVRRETKGLLLDVAASKPHNVTESFELLLGDTDMTSNKSSCFPRRAT